MQNASRVEALGLVRLLWTHFLMNKARPVANKILVKPRVGGGVGVVPAVHILHSVARFFFAVIMTYDLQIHISMCIWV